MAEFAGYFRYCLNTGKLLLLAVLVSGGVVLHVLVSISPPTYINMWLQKKIIPFHFKGN